jgi:hypothetical protein
VNESLIEAEFEDGQLATGTLAHIIDHVISPQASMLCRLLQLIEATLY